MPVRDDPPPIPTVSDLKREINEACTAYVMGKIGPGLMQHRIGEAVKRLPTNQASKLVDWLIYATE